MNSLERCSLPFLVLYSWTVYLDQAKQAKRQFVVTLDLSFCPVLILFKTLLFLSKLQSYPAEIACFSSNNSELSSRV